jgi:hypothetical protein
MDDIFGDLVWLQRLIDDLLIQAKTKQQALRRLKIVLKKCRENNVTIKASKIQMGPGVEFGGFVVAATKDGVAVTPDPKKVEAIRAFKSPANAKDLRSFLGLAGTLSAWNPDYSNNKTGWRSSAERMRHHQVDAVRPQAQDGVVHRRLEAVQDGVHARAPRTSSGAGPWASA